MHVTITGGTGLIGRALTQHLEARGDEATIASRSPTGANQIGWDPYEPGSLTLPDATDAVIHLAGAPIVGARWTEPYKQELLESRVQGTQTVVQAVQEHGGIDQVISGSAVGFYGDRGEQVLTEEDRPGSDFLAGVCQAWEDAALPVRKDDTLDTRLAWVRTGVVLSTEEGALAEMLNPFGFVKPFHWGLGGRVGSGEQWFPWIHIEDEVRAILHVLDRGLAGPFNLAAPNPVRNKVFVDALGDVLGRPTVLPTPSFALRMLYGEAADVLFASQCVVPHRLQESGFEFRFKSLTGALEDLLG